MARTNESYLRWKFGRLVAKGYAPNVMLVAPGDTTSAALEPGESAIARIALESDATPLLLTDARLLRGTESVLRFAEVRSCYWIHRDWKVAAELKQSKYHRLVFDLSDGREVVIEGLGQAVFPLFSFFQKKPGRAPAG